MKVLVVDDSATQRLIVKSIVNNYEGVANVFEATDGTKALLILKTEKIDLVFSDINMEPMSGFELIEKAKADNINSKFVFITSHLTETVKEKAKAAGGSFYITKPITQEKIENVLKEVSES